MKKLFLILLLLVPGISFAEEYTCPNVYLNNELPTVKYDKVLCFKDYSVLYSTKYKIPLVSSEHLTSTELHGAEDINRKNSFHREEQLPVEDASNPKDYAKSGYDMGHMSPAGDMPDMSSQYESFSLSNMTPQTPQLNRIVWRKIEGTVRAMAKQYGEVYVVTGAIVSDTSVEIHDGIKVPDLLYKAVYVPSNGASQVFVAPNDTTKTFKIMTLGSFAEEYGITPFPALKN